MFRPFGVRISTETRKSTATMEVFPCAFKAWVYSSFCLYFSRLALPSRGPTASPENRPATPLQARAFGSDGELVMQWKVQPGQGESSIVGYKILRKEAPIQNATEAQIKTELIADVKLPITDGVAGAKKAAAKVMGYTDRQLTMGNWYTYLIHSYNVNKEVSKTPYILGPFQAIAPEEAPRELTATSGDGAVEITWQPYPPRPYTMEERRRVEAGETVKVGPTHYINLYRSEDKGAFPSSPVNRTPLAKGIYMDNAVPLNTPLHYRARALGQVAPNVWFEGAPGPEVVVTAQDENPPSPPLIEWVWVLSEKITLRWQQSTDGGLLGYRLLRRPANNEEAKWDDTSGFISVNEFTDNGLPSSGDYDYKVEAWDKSGNYAQSGTYRIAYTAGGNDPSAKSGNDLLFAAAPKPVKAKKSLVPVRGERPPTPPGPPELPDPMAVEPFPPEPMEEEPPPAPVTAPAAKPAKKKPADKPKPKEKKKKMVPIMPLIPLTP